MFSKYIKEFLKVFLAWDVHSVYTQQFSFSHLATDPVDQ